MQNENYQGLLFTKDFLTEGVKNQAAWQSLSDEDVANFASQCKEMLARIDQTQKPNEAQTCKIIINPILNLLGWDKCHIPEETISSGRPDGLLYEDEQKYAVAAKNKKNRENLAVAMLENKKWQLPLDRRDKKEGTPSSQILRYFNNSDSENIDWAILTNGSQWRLYYRRAQSRSEHFLELNLPEIMQLSTPPPPEKNHWLRLFMLMFCRNSFLPKHSENRTFHHVALEEGKNWEEAITDSLSRKIMEDVFPQLAEALANSIPELKDILTDSTPNKHKQRADELLQEVRDNTVLLLFRLLFVLYAEDRHLLPILNDNYHRYSLRKMRDDIEKDLSTTGGLSVSMSIYYERFIQLSNAIDKGDKSLSLPPYNGGLFDSSRTILHSENTKLKNNIFGKVIHAFSLHNGRRIHYHDLSVQHLGAIYEEILEQELYITPEGKVATRLSRYSRKSSGSYYTPDELVRLIIERTIGGLLQQRKDDFTKAQKENLEGKELSEKDSAAQSLQIKVCDPAMGSGHFLVSLVDYLADWTLSEMSAAEAIKNYESPLVKEIEDIRQHIKGRAKKGGWEINESQLEDRQIIRRIVLKKCIYGADKNFMAVELSKLSLWLHTFTVGAPLTFLDHHLRCGDSLFGEWGISAREQFNKLDCRLEGGQHINKAESAAEEMSEIELLPDSDIKQVSYSKQKYEEMSEKAKTLSRAMSLLHVMRWLDAVDKDLTTEERKDNKQKRQTSAQRILMNWFDPRNSLTQKDIALREQANDMIKRESFIHWEVAFPGVWTKWGSPKDREGGFDAIIGNPPWSKMRMDDIEWFKARMPEVSSALTKAARREKISALQKSNAPIIDEYNQAAENATASMVVARSCGDYPQLSGGDTNLYSLFVERALTLAKPNAFIGLLVPSGIYGDQTASKFFNSITTSSRLHTLFDFVNGPSLFFHDVHRSFKFCAFIFGGTEQKFSKTECAYFINDINKIDNQIIEFESGDFRRVNPNTGNSPIFRNQRDAKITLDIYRRLPIMHKQDERSVFPAKHFYLFHMSGDSALFKTDAELQNDSYYLVNNNCYKKGNEIYVPLYEGKMVQTFDHRAADIIINKNNLSRPGQQVSTSIEQKQNVNFFSNPRFWVPLKNVNERFSSGFGDKEKKKFNFSPQAVIAFKSTSASTNMRGMIAAILPSVGIGHNMSSYAPIISKHNEEQPIDEWLKVAEKEMADYKEVLPFIVANFNSFIYDFLCRQKMQGQHISSYIVKQLPIIPVADYSKKIGKKIAADIVRSHVLQLTYTATDMAGFADDMGYKGNPFIWDETKRLHLQARLDALYFILYGIEKNDLEYIMDSFPIVKKSDKKQHGGYLTRDLIIAYMNALNAGDPEVEVALPRY